MSACDVIRVRDVRAACRVGVSAGERGRPQEIRIDAELSCDLRKAGASDRLEDTVDYVCIRDELVRAAGASEFTLLEALAERLAAVCLAPARVRSVRVRVAKLAAGGGNGLFVVELRRAKTPGRGEA